MNSISPYGGGASVSVGYGQPNVGLSYGGNNMAGYGNAPSYNNAAPGYGMPVMQQPMPSGLHQVAIHTQPKEMVHELAASHWQVGLCDCFHACSTCALVTLCTPIAECIAANKLNENCCYPFFFPNGIVAVSTRFRTLNHIEMGMCEEACLFSFCRLCMLCRLLNEMQVRGYH